MDNISLTKNLNKSTLSLEAKNTLVKVTEDFLDIKNRLLVSLDIETTGLVPSIHEIRSIQMIVNNKEIFIDCAKVSKDDIAKELQILKGAMVCGYNVQFDLGFLAHHFDFNILEWDIIPMDIFIAAQLDRYSNLISEELINNKHISIKDYRYDNGKYKPKFGLGHSLKFYLNIELDKSLQKSFYS